MKLCAWRLGPELCEQKFRYVLETDRKPDDALAEAEADLHTVRADFTDASETPCHLIGLQLQNEAQTRID